jgi:xylan 1,4-beta-xylosidase
MALRADWQGQVRRCHEELGFEHVRFHGILSDDVGTLIRQAGRLVYSFFNTDRIWDFVLSIGMRPFVELSFMPEALASGPSTVFHYRANVTPPKSYERWQTFMGKLIGHWVDRYGRKEVARWLFEVWNEPNLEAFWTGSRADYFKLYRHTASAMKDIDPSLQVGGPATANNGWISEFLDYCERYDVPADFLTTHHYPTDAFGQPGDDTVTQLSLSRRSVLRERATEARGKARGHRLYYTEWNTSSNPFDDLHDQPFAAAFIAKTVMEVAELVDGYSYWTFSDLFEENYFSSVPFHGGFGLLTIDGIPKPAYRAFELLHRLGTERLSVEGQHETVDAWVTRSEGGSLKVLLTNFALPRHAIRAERVTIRLVGREAARAAYVERIDEDHANPRRVWTEAGSSPSLSREEVATLEATSRLSREPASWTRAGGATVFSIVLPPQAVAVLSIELA